MTDDSDDWPDWMLHAEARLLKWGSVSDQDYFLPLDQPPIPGTHRGTLTVDSVDHDAGTFGVTGVERTPERRKHLRWKRGRMVWE